SALPLNDQTSAPVFGRVAPNRIFVGGISLQTSENDLKMFFGQYGTVKEVKIINDRAGASKGYGFVTFEAPEDAQKILQKTKKIHYKDQKWNIGPAVRKQRRRMCLSTSSEYPPGGDKMYLTSSGCPYVYRNGTAYFHPSEVASLSQPCSVSNFSSVMVPQPVYQPPTYHFQAPTQCLPNQLQWPPQVPTQSFTCPPPLLHAQPCEVIYQPVGITQENGGVPPPLVVQATVSEVF
ncbi:BOLL protein, partial [Rhinopomastus cyanomelas]|nr:BOLL protein [Rhinopomastus cyanomelas]